MFFVTLKIIQNELQKYREFSKFSSVKINVMLQKIMKKLLRKVSDFFHKFETIFNSKNVEFLFFHRVNDHKIELTIKIFALSKSHVYFLSSKKLEVLKTYLKKNLIKGFISSNKVLFVFSILFAVKLNDQLRLCVNYRKFNVITRRNSYSISFIKKTLTRVISYKHIFKLNIIVAFNKFKINFKSENFITFICSLKIYKYHVLFFDFINGFVS